MLCEVIGSDSKSCTERAVLCVRCESSAGCEAHGVQRTMRSAVWWGVMGWSVAEATEGLVGRREAELAGASSHLDLPNMETEKGGERLARKGFAPRRPDHQDADDPTTARDRLRQARRARAFLGIAREACHEYESSMVVTAFEKESHPYLPNLDPIQKES